MKSFAAIPVLSALALVKASPISPVARHLKRANQTCESRSYEGDSDLAVSIPTGVPIFYLEAPLEYIYEVAGGSQSFKDADYCGIKNDTCLFVVTDGAEATFTDVSMTKFGYTSDLNQASFFGLNAVVNVANGSHAAFVGTNITSHNGAAGIYSYGTGTTVNVTDMYFTATGPVSHGLYAGGNGSIEAHNFNCKAYGYRSSCLSGDNPAGDLYVYDSDVRMWGLGSAVAYTVGSTYLDNVFGYTYQSFALIADGTQKVEVHNSDIEGGINFATVVLFGSQPAYKYGTASFYNTILRSHGDDHAIFGFANAYGTIYATNITTVSESDMLAVSNATGITQTFDHWRSVDEGAAANPAFGTINLVQSKVSGSIQAINGSTLSLSLADSSSWTGAAIADSTENTAQIGISIDSTSKWIVSGTSTLHNLTISDNDLSSITSNGHKIYYNATSSVNSWLNGTIHSLSGGGSLEPLTSSS